MSKAVKKVLSVLLCAALLFGAAPLSGFAGLRLPELSALFAPVAHAADPSGTCGTNLTWAYDTTTATLTISGTGEMNNYDFSSYNGTYVTTAPWRPYYNTMQTLVINSGVTSISEAAFYNCTGLTSVTIPNSVTSIGEDAFCICTGLTSVTIPDSVTSIGYYAFYGCTGLTSVTIGNSVTRIGNYAFYGCTGLTSVTIPDSVTSISNHAFYGCTGLTSVTIPDSVTSIGGGAFDLVPNVVYHGSAGGSPWGARAVNGYVEGSLVYADSTKTALLACPSSYQGEIAIPDSVTSIGDSAFFGCTDLTSVTIGNSVTSIGDSAFRGCTGLTSVTIGNSVTSIGNLAFLDCTGLTSITIPDSVTSIGVSAFRGCNNLTSMTLPFVGASRTATGSSSVFGYIFGYTSSSSESGTVMQNYASGSSTYSYYYYIPSLLREITITDATQLSYGAFYNCSFLTSVTIPDSVTSIHNYAFYNCTGLKDVYYTGTQEQWNRISIGSSNGPLTNATLHVHVHTYYGVVTKVPTCTEKGVKTFTCSTCGDSYTEPIDKLPHTPKTVTVPATCTEPGVQYDACEVCGEKLTADTVLPATGHAYSSVVTKAPNCLEDGVRTYTCAACGDSYTETIEKAPHTPSDWIVLRQPVVCTSSGLRMKLCTVCGQTLEREEISPHQFGEWVVTTPVTCTEDGVETRTCADCGAEETRPIAALGHDYVETVIAPTCVEPGFTTHVCSRCGNSYATDPVPAAGHVYSEWMMLVDPTLTSEGVMGRKCTVCGTVLDEMPVPKLAGDHVTGLQLDKEKVFLNPGETLTLTAEVLPATALNKTVAWLSTAVSVVTVENGVVTPVAPGIAAVVVQAEDGGVIDFCMVQVNAVTAQNGASIDSSRITGLSVNLNSFSDYLTLADGSMTLRYSADTIGTGTKVLVTQGDTVINEFEAVIFGDVDGNSWYDGTDAYFVKLVANGLISADALTDAQRMAADCNHDGVIDNADAALLEQAGLLLANVNQSAPQEELQLNSVYQEYLEMIEQTPDSVEPEADEEPPAAEKTGLIETILRFFRAVYRYLFNLIFVKVF